MTIKVTGFDMYEHEGVVTGVARFEGTSLSTLLAYFTLLHGSPGGAAPVAPVAPVATEPTKAVRTSTPAKVADAAPVEARKPAPVVKEIEPVAAPVTVATPVSDEPPVALKQAGSFRHVMEYMLSQGLTELEEIRAECAKYATSVPVLSRLDLATVGDRIGRALVGMSELVDAAKAKKSS